MSFYNKFYAKGGWRYYSWLEKWKLARRVVKPLNLHKGSRVLELGCGMGLHTHLLQQLGFDAVGVDISEIGIKAAKERYPATTFYACDAKDLASVVEKGDFDFILVRGMSWYHYELLGVNEHGVNVPEATQELFEFLKPGGVFVLIIRTDFSGTIAEDGVHLNRYEDYVSLFSRLGDIVMITDATGTQLPDREAALRSGKDILIATRRGA